VRKAAAAVKETSRLIRLARMYRNAHNSHVGRILREKALETHRHTTKEQNETLHDHQPHLDAPDPEILDIPVSLT